MTAARQAKRLSQITLALELNTTQSTYSDWESGKRSPPPRMIKKIALAVGIPAAAILPPEIKGLAQNQAEMAEEERPDIAFGNFAAAFIRAAQEAAGPTLPLSLALAQARRIWSFAGGDDHTTADLDRLEAGMQMLLDTYHTIGRSRPEGDTEKTG